MRFAIMKLKHRVVILSGLICCTLVFVGLVGYVQLNPSTALGQNIGASVHLEPRGHHLAVMRKDLDLSNYTSESKDGVRSDEMGSNEAMRMLHDGLFREKSIINKRVVTDLLSLVDMMQNMTEKELLTKLAAEEGVVPERKAQALWESQQTETGTGRGGHAAEEHAVATEGINLTDRELKTLSSIRSTHRRIKKDVYQLNLYTGRNISAWKQFQNHISQYQMYGEDDPAVEQLIKNLVNEPIVDVIMKSGGTQLKLTFYFPDDGRAMFKPQRFPREQADTWPNHFYFSDFERHHAEIASFHLDRLLGFRRTPPTVGRFMNVTSEIKDFVTQQELLKTFFVSPAGNKCFHGQCDYYCDTGHAVCGNPDLLQGSMASYLPTSRRVGRMTWRHPWRRSYHKRKKAEWETDNTYCSRIRRHPPYNTGRRLLDIMDMSVFDFFTGNLDRHHYETFSYYGNNTYPLHLDQGRAFGKPYYDDLSILAPIYQCCLMRYTTLKNLLKFYKGPETLSSAMRRVLSTDQVAPVLLDPHLKALDRRLVIILKTVYKCLQKNKFIGKVVVDDGF